MHRRWSHGRAGALALLAAMLVVPGTAGAKKAPGGPPTEDSSTAFAGRAYALEAHLSLIQVIGGGVTVNVGPVSDTGQLPPGGGMIDRSLLTLSTPDPLAIELGLLNAATMGSGDRAVSWASVVDLDINVAGVLQIYADVLEATAKSTCGADGSKNHGSSSLVDLVIIGGGKRIAVPVDAPPNTVIEIPGLAEIVVNEQKTDANGRFYVNALRVSVGGVLSPLATASVIVAHAETGVDCGTGTPQCPVKDFVTGGGWILLPSGDKGTFGFVGGQKANGLQGHLTYQDHGNGTKVFGTSVSSYSGSGTAREITYACTVGGKADTCVVDVADNGEPGGGRDVFEIESSRYPHQGGTITKGNVQLHQPNCGTSGGGGGNGKGGGRR